MDIFNVLTMIGGLCLFLFGMNLMGDALERRAGSSLRVLLGKLTTNRMLGFLTGLAVTGVIQSSSATTVMVVGFVNSGIMKLTNAVGIIMGANIGTTATGWLLSLASVGSSGAASLFSTATIFAVVAVIGIPLVACLRLGLIFLNQYCLTWSASHVVMDLRQDLLRKIQEQSLQFHGRIDVGQLMSRATSDPQVMQNLIQSMLAELCRAPFEILVAVVFIIWFAIANHMLATLGVIAIADRKSTRLNSSHRSLSRMPSSA